MSFLGVRIGSGSVSNSPGEPGRYLGVRHGAGCGGL